MSCGGVLERSNADLTFLKIAQVVALLSTCTRTRIGCVIVRDGRIISIGHNGNSKCTYDNCYRTNNRANNSEYVNYCIGLHAEWRALISGYDFQGAVMYCTMQPCAVCARMIVGAGISKIVYEMEYHDAFNDDILKDIETVHVPRVSRVGEIISEMSKMDDPEQREILAHVEKMIRQEKYDY